MRLLDVGCGWGSMAIHAAQHHGAQVVGITISRGAGRPRRERVADAGLPTQVEIRVQDYRDVADGPFDAISSIGMFEHVGEQQMGEYFDRPARAAPPGGPRCSTTPSPGRTPMTQRCRPRLVHGPLRVPRRRAASRWARW